MLGDKATGSPVLLVKDGCVWELRLNEVDTDVLCWPIPDDFFAADLQFGDENELARGWFSETVRRYLNGERPHDVAVLKAGNSTGAPPLKPCPLPLEVTGGTKMVSYWWEELVHGVAHARERADQRAQRRRAWARIETRRHTGTGLTSSSESGRCIRPAGGLISGAPLPKSRYCSHWPLRKTAS